MKQYSFWSIAYKTTVIHTVTYFVIGLLSFLFFDYGLRYADPAVASTLRQTDHPMVTAGPLFQVLRGFLFGIVFYVLRDIFFSKPRGWTTIWLVLIFVGILSPFSAAPGSIEGLVYSTLPMWFHIMSLPELFIQSFLLALLTHYWVNHPEKKMVVDIVRNCVCGRHTAGTTWNPCCIGVPACANIGSPNRQSR